MPKRRPQMRTNGLELVPSGHQNSISQGYSGANMSNYNNQGFSGYQMPTYNNQTPSYMNNTMPAYVHNPTPNYATNSIQNYNSMPNYNTSPTIPNHSCSHHPMNNYNNNGYNSHINANTSTMYSNNNHMQNWANMFPAAHVASSAMPPVYNNPVAFSPESLPMSNFVPSPMSNSMQNFNSWTDSPMLRSQMIETPRGEVPLWPGTVYEPPECKIDNTRQMQFQNMPSQMKMNTSVAFGTPMINGMEMCGDMGGMQFNNSYMIPPPPSMSQTSIRGRNPGENKIINTPMGTIEKIGETRRMVNMPNGDMEILGKVVRPMGVPNISNGCGSNFTNYGIPMNMNRIESPQMGTSAPIRCYY